MPRRSHAAAAAAVLALATPAAAQAHVSIHPNVLPSGGYATVSLRVPDELDDARTTLVRMQLPEGFTSVSVQPPAGWSVSYKTQRLARPVQSDDGPISEEVREVDWRAKPGAGIAPEQFLQFPLALLIPARAGTVLSFPTLQTYSNGSVVRWIGPADSESPAPTVDVSRANGPLLDVTGGEAGPAPDAATTALASAPARAPAPVVAQSSTGASKGLAITALVVGILGLLAAIAAFLTSRRRLSAA